ATSAGRRNKSTESAGKEPLPGLARAGVTPCVPDRQGGIPALANPGNNLETQPRAHQHPRSAGLQAAPNVTGGIRVLRPPLDTIAANNPMASDTGGDPVRRLPTASGTPSAPRRRSG